MKKILAAGAIALAMMFASVSPGMAAETATADKSSEVTFSPEVLKHAENATEFAPAGDESRAGFVPYATFQVTSKQPNTRMTNVLTSCRNPGGTCTLSKTVTQTASITAGGGISFSVLNANLGGGYSNAVALGVSCTSPKLSFGQVYNAYPMGTFVMFKYNGVAGTAFLPTGVDCRVAAG
ncbi:hypothetical protein [Arthrobacter glacialis]|uniref:Uncharacterized protein n=1 Tax=Arthrobacter glacialis TaxID=1664 RepID=A0A2S4A167_ARTGL|nr:hypothetical protein [Arthrobacter glacialis]POH75178.1 hypothetical protein CVS27_00770 [Arthrobacter glacialis]